MNKNNNKESINFKININNVSNYSIKNNCVNINNDNNNNKNNINKNEQTKNINEKKAFNKSQIYEEKKEENFKINHDYSNDDILQNTDRILSSNEKEKEKSDLLVNLSNDKIKITNENNKTKGIENNFLLKFWESELSKDKSLDQNNYSIIKRHKKIVLKRNKEMNDNEKNYNSINYSNDTKIYVDDEISQKKNTINARYNNNKNILFKKKISKQNHRILCHKFTDNPQHFFTVKLTESMIKQIIKNRNKNN